MYANASLPCRIGSRGAPTSLASSSVRSSFAAASMASCRRTRSCAIANRSVGTAALAGGGSGGVTCSPDVGAAGGGGGGAASAAHSNLCSGQWSCWHAVQQYHAALHLEHFFVQPIAAHFGRAHCKDISTTVPLATRPGLGAVSLRGPPLASED
eukprot:4637764-Prymnesium_polylepis.1